MSEFANIAVILKLISGDTIICQVLSDTDKNIIIRDPFQINVFNEKMDDGVKSMTYYSDWFLGSSTRIHMLRKEHILSATIPDDSVKSDYSTLIDNRKDSKNTSSKTDTNSWGDLNFKIDKNDDLTRN